MKFRIIEIKEPHNQSKYIPQYKKKYWYFKWNNIIDDEFLKSVFCNNEFKNRSDKIIWSKFDAEKLIREFKTYIEDKSSHRKIHKI